MTYDEYIQPPREHRGCGRDYLCPSDDPDCEPEVEDDDGEP
jgi:hypothetical protein